MEKTHRKEKIYFVCQFDYNRENTGDIMINGISCKFCVNNKRRNV